MDCEETGVVESDMRLPQGVSILSVMVAVLSLLTIVLGTNATIILYQLL